MTRYVFGPVPSRRLGRSLGVDLAPFKTCMYGTRARTQTAFRRAARKIMVDVFRLLSSDSELTSIYRRKFGRGAVLGARPARSPSSMSDWSARSFIRCRRIPRTPNVGLEPAHPLASPICLSAPMSNVRKVMNRPASEHPPCQEAAKPQSLSQQYVSHLNVRPHSHIDGSRNSGRYGFTRFNSSPATSPGRQRTSPCCGCRLMMPMHAATCILACRLH